VSGKRGRVQTLLLMLVLGAPKTLEREVETGEGERLRRIRGRGMTGFRIVVAHE
jgi:hypothetical protein